MTIFPTTDTLSAALYLAERGFHVFPCEPGGKIPLIKNFPSQASRDPEQIKKWFVGTTRNVGISTSRFGDNEALVVVDVDKKNGKDGEVGVLALEMQGYELPLSLEQTTPSGGRHILYRVDRPLKQGTNVLGDGIDIRSRGGYIIGPGSTVDGRTYAAVNTNAPLAQAPQWLEMRLGRAKEKTTAQGKIVLPGVDAHRARERALAYLETAPVSVEGNGGDSVAYKVAAAVKDKGCTQEETLDLLLDHWNEGCSPPWSVDALAEKVAHAYRYGQKPQGAEAPEAVFAAASEDGAKTKHPVEKINDEYAFIKSGAFVLQETTDHKGRFCTIRLSPADMHAWFANKTLAFGDKKVALSKLWMQDAGRREYDSVVFAPRQTVPPRFYNLWRGFSVEPADTADHPSVAAFLEHALKNVCHNDAGLFRWLMGYFAHLIQKPWEKPLVALVFKGAKGTGKNALVERVGHLLGSHFILADEDRYLLSNFNSHLEANLFFVLDEASWGGDKRAEGKLKGIITGSEYLIERKGAEPYKVDNLTRAAIIGNENWLVPATEDERRFAVFNVGEGRRKDRSFFREMRVGMERDGYANLLRYFLDYDLTDIDINDAPQTQGLIDQKHATLSPAMEWWLDCLQTNSLAGGSWDGDLPDAIPTNRFRRAFEEWAKSRNIRSRLPGRNAFFNEIIKTTPSMRRVKARVGETEDSTYNFCHSGIAMLRDEWDKFIGGRHVWE